MALTTPVLADGLRRIAAHMETVADELNALDGQLGDGDLGVTMTRGGRALLDIVPTLPADVGMALMACAQAMTKVSGSSYGTLLATGLLTAAKATRGRTEVPWSETAALLRAAFDAMKTRGKSALGDKTVLDAIDAAATAAEGETEPARDPEGVRRRGGRNVGTDARHAGENRSCANLRRTICRAGRSGNARVQRCVARPGRVVVVGARRCGAPRADQCAFSLPV